MSAHRSIDGSGGCEEITRPVIVGELLYVCSLCCPPLVLDVTNFSLYRHAGLGVLLYVCVAVLVVLTIHNGSSSKNLCTVCLICKCTI